MTWSRAEASLRVITARLSHTPTSCGCERAHEHSQSRRAQMTVLRQLCTTASTAGSLVSFWKASAVTAAIRSAHSAATAVAACQAAAYWRAGPSLELLTTASSHRGLRFASRRRPPHVDDLRERFLSCRCGADPGWDCVVDGPHPDRI